MKTEAFLIDIGGVLTIGDDPVPGSGEALEYIHGQGFRFRLLSNTTRKSRAGIVSHLRSHGFRIAEEEIVTAPVAAASMILETGADRCFLLSTGDVHQDFLSAGITLADEDVDFVVVADAGANFTYEGMNRTFRLVMDGAALIALEKDRFWMGREGIMLAAGPFVAALEFAAGIRAEVVGKPSPAFFSRALLDMGTSAEETAMVGDDIAVDIGGAKSAGLRAILVKTGKYHADEVARSPVRPYVVIESFSRLPALFTSREWESIDPVHGDGE